MNAAPNSTTADVVLIGGGITSATLGSMLTVLRPDLSIVMLERAAAVATESSDPWNNAGTGHSGYCELNYMPDPLDGAKPAQIADQFAASRGWWHDLADRGLLDQSTFLSATPHLDVVFGERDVEYLRTRFQTLRTDPRFAAMEFSEDPEQIAEWAPLVMDGRAATGEPIAATRHPDGTDVDFGALTRALTKIVTDQGGRLHLGHEVRALKRGPDGAWSVIARRDDGARVRIRAPFVFVGAGGFALHLLQKARLREVRGYAVLPVGAAFFRCSTPGVVDRHDGKVYGQAPIGAPPMSVPHLDKRIVDGGGHLMFGPYATFSTKLLKHGRLTDTFKTLRWHNLPVIAAAMLQNLSLIRYLISELVAGPRRKFRQLQRYCPGADFDDWELIAAGRRAQLVTPDRRRIGVLQQGTELVVSEDRSMAGLLGASPGASTAVPIMRDVLARCF
ncbi:MAG: malate:quinone oxidoreductase [Gordonia sp. (in: high G+C Gram-positive bacteria)]